MRFKMPVLVLGASLALLSLPVAASPRAWRAAGAVEPASDAVAGQRAPLSPAGRAFAAAQDPQAATYYIVHLAAKPLARYDGALPSLAPTSPRALGEAALDTDSPASLAYLAYLDRSQATTIATVERALGRRVELLHRYRYAFNGLSLWLSPAEAERVGRLPGVLRVERNVVEPLNTDVGPVHIGAPTLWDGSATGGLPGTKGEGVVIGVIDTGINVDHPSFAAIGPVDGYQHVNPRPGFLGWCAPSNPNHDAKYACNAKLIGLWSFPDASMNPEDEDGHGSHTSSTAGGNAVMGKATSPTFAIERPIQGVAPHANLIMYDACAPGGCNSTATTAAIDQAAADGVDVINYSIGIGRNSPWHNSRLMAFMGAFEAGVFVSASAGNDGVAESVNGTAPWMTSVAATTHGRGFANSLIGMTGGEGAAPADIDGASITGPFGPAAIRLAAGALKADGTADDGSCLEPFPAGTFNGEIVVCDRGVIGRVAKSENALAGGAGGFVLVNLPANGSSVVADPYVIPGLNIGADDGAVLKAWLATGTGHRAGIKGSVINIDPTKADQVAGFSSRGPALTAICCRRPDLDMDATALDLLKPDIGAPGVDILAAVGSPAGSTAPEFGLLSGTSMASPHLAGSAALITALHPDWTAPQIQSALMLTSLNQSAAAQTGATPLAPFDRGAGRVDLTAAARTGIVLDESAAAFAAADPDRGGQPSTLNLASMADAWCFGPCSWTRRLQSTRAEGVVWTAQIQPWPGEAGLPAGLTVSVNPTSFTLAAKGTQSLTVKADAETMAVGDWAFAQLLLTAAGDAAPSVHMPIVIRRVDRRIAPAVTIYTDKTTGSHRLEGQRAPAILELALDPAGLVKGDADTAMVAPDPTNQDPYDSLDGTLVITRTVPEGARRIVAEMLGSSAVDIDMYLGHDANGDGRPQAEEQICVSGRESWDEFCDVSEPTAGPWWIMLVNFKPSAGPTDRIDFVTGVVPAISAGNLRVSGPASQPAGEPFTLNLDWTLPGLMAGDRWFGAVDVGSSPSARGDLGMIAVDIIGEGPSQPTPTPVTGQTPTPIPTPTVMVSQTAPPSATPTPRAQTPPPPATATPVRPTATLPAAPSATTAPVPSATASGMCICSLIQNGGRNVPQAAIDAAVADPGKVSGYGQPAVPGKPVSPFNPLRECLSIRNPANSYHPLFNSLVFKAGCP
ncbi:MAG: S8 family serine peptidase [Ardenticatenia bacterium]|nr:S8 family serine peptidase [Ardenticatenia bacterium]